MGRGGSHKNMKKPEISSTIHKTRAIVHNALFSSKSLILALFGNITIFPIFPFLKLDFSEFPVYLATLIYGIPSGLSVLFTVSLIRMLLFSTSGIIGFIIRSSSVIIILFLGLSLRFKNKILKFFIITIGLCINITVKLLLNYYFWINFFAISREFLSSALFKIILPYNFIKLSLCIILAIYFKRYIKNKLKGSYEI